MAKYLEKSLPAFRFCPDEWIKEIWPKSIAETEGNSYRDSIEQLQWKVGKRAIVLGNSVIIEWGTWGRDEREKLRGNARKLGARVKLYYLAEPREVMKERILLRNHNLGEHEFFIAPEEIERFLDNCLSQIQVPAQDEIDTYDEVDWLPKLGL